MKYVMSCGRANIAWDAAHRVTMHESKCRTLHGHRYSATIVAEAATLDDVDRVVDFGVIKAKVGTWIDDHWDHTTLVNVGDRELLEFATREAELHAHRLPFVLPGEPTAETIAAYLFDVAQDLLGDDRLRVVEVTVWETPNCFARVEGRAWDGESV
jgi:6-pyruvoyltetrahydropterin/6-carboxytetrahydropterin synthase